MQEMSLEGGRAFHKKRQSDSTPVDTQAILDKVVREGIMKEALSQKK